MFSEESDYNKSMKTRIYFLTLIPFILSLSGCIIKNKSNNDASSSKEISSSSQVEDLGPVDVVIISGQSNAVGCTHSIYLPDTVTSEKYNEYFNGYDDVKIAYDCWTKDWPASGITYFSQNTSGAKNFVNVELGQGNGTETFGPEIGISDALHQKHANKLFLIKFACGGSNLKDDWLAKNSPMYPKLIDYVNLQMGNLENEGYKPTIKAFCWMQGEGDSYPGYYTSYQDNLRTFVSNIRSDLKDLSGKKEIPFIDAAINPDRSVWQYGPEVNEAKVAFAAESENNFFIDTVAAGLHTDQEPTYSVDRCHYDSDSQIQLGHLFAEKIEPFLMK